MRITRTLALCMLLSTCVPDAPAVAQLFSSANPGYVNCPSCAGSGSANQRVNAQAGDFVAGSIVDLSTGGLIDTDLKALLKSGQTIAATQSGTWTVGINGAVVLGAGSATIGGVTQSGTWNIGTVSSITNPIGLAAGSNVIGSIANTTFAATQSGAWNVGLNAGTNNIGAITGNAGYNDAVAASVAASGTSANTYHAAPIWATKFNCRGLSTQSGNFFIGETLAGGTAVAVYGPIAITANGPFSYSVPIVGSADQDSCYVINGSTAATVTIATSFTAN